MHATAEADHAMSADLSSDDEGDVPPLLSAPPTPATAPTPAPKKAVQAAMTPSANHPHKAGDLVTVVGLVSKPELNGREARVTEYHEAKGRFAVELVDRGTLLSLKAANLRPRPPAKEPSGGIKKGFLDGGDGSGSGGGGGASAKTPAAAERDGLTMLRKAEGADPLKLPDVQRSMDEQAANASAARVGGGGAPEWVTPALLQKIAGDPLLRKAFTDPQCGAAMAALQQDPKKAMETYGDVPEMKEFLMKFMGLMGEHFTKLGELGAAAGGVAGAAPGAAPGVAPGAAPSVNAIARPKQPKQPLVQPVQAAEPLSEEEQRVQDAMRDPEVVAILKDSEVQTVLQKLQMGRAHEVEGCMSRPDMVRKLQRLSQAGLIGMHWER